MADFHLGIEEWFGPLSAALPDRHCSENQANAGVERRLNERILPQSRTPRLQSGYQFFSKRLNELFDLGESAT